MESVIRKWGNSPALRLPTAVLKEAGFRLGQIVRIVVSSGRIVIQPAERVQYDLEDLVGRITASNSHREFSVGKPSGKESP